jgi:hypothetical protein
MVVLYLGFCIFLLTLLGMGGMTFKMQNVCLKLMLCWLYQLRLWFAGVLSEGLRFCVAPVCIPFQCTDTVHGHCSLVFMIECVLAAWSIGYGADAPFTKKAHRMHIFVLHAWKDLPWCFARYKRISIPDELTNMRDSSRVQPLPWFTHTNTRKNLFLVYRLMVHLSVKHNGQACIKSFQAKLVVYVYRRCIEQQQIPVRSTHM